ncbi:MAG: class I SAM-dependent methyltransferase [Ilumatobacter sp.]|uniref:class I SAM-dependent methyltransferase n=1 Tax=Ilumatobacter sp. TaxID=1967498 RepID=UPI002635776F|nr:class I SAM-dependent methyltransferase [Ilumatobacter sp.]MDJ0769929.1 class I SAM-dependent methyltransferase [Ilumatobacter sp.]
MSDGHDRLRLFSAQVFGKLEGAMTAGMIHLGDRLGLYRALADADQPMTSVELAVATDLHERWVREWLHNQAAARLLDHDVADGDDRFSMSREAKAVLATPDHPAFGMGMFHRLPATMQSLERMPESFETGLGHDYDSHGAQGAEGIERSFEPWNNANLLRTVLPAMDGVVDLLQNGARLADVGCGAGSAVMMMAEAFPNSEFVGYDISRHALDRARAKLASSPLPNARFIDPRDERLPRDGSFDVITTFDCIHDMSHPQDTIDAIRLSLHDDGHWLLVDIDAADDLAGNMEANPMASLLYGVSVLSCMSSAMSEPGGAGLGTLGLPASKAEEMARAAGFTRFERLPVDHAVNAFYEIRP